MYLERNARYFENLVFQPGIEDMIMPHSDFENGLDSPIYSMNDI